VRRITATENGARDGKARISTLKVYAPSFPSNLPRRTGSHANFTLLSADEKPLFAPRPTKGAKASKTHAQGAGIFDIAVDKASGKVTSVHVRSSTNNVMVDADVMNTFLQWRFKPNTQYGVTIVVAFAADSDTAYYPVVHSLRATSRGLPVDFKEPVKPEKLWQWFPELYGAAGHQ
jgi:TonB family protein